MKIIFDFDGVLTDYNRFVQKIAIGYFRKKYHLEVINSDELEIENIFDIQNILEHSGYSAQEANVIKKKMMDRFWVSHRFISFSLLSRFRPGVRKYINYLRKLGFVIEVHSSRAKTSENGALGRIARVFTIWQCWLNGVFLRRKQFFFYLNDKEKTQGIKSRHPILVFDDKKQIVDELSKADMKVICISGTHNKMVCPSKNIEIVSVFDKCILEQKTEKLFGKANWTCHKREVVSLRFFKKLSIMAIVLRLIFRPIILHPENMISNKEEAIIYAPNHRSTLDPLIIESVFTEHIHWAALSRFLKGEDSIFNNSKNSVLRNITKNAFLRLEYFPIERRSDNQEANNMESLKDMNLFLRNGYKVGIFPEGTTKRQEGKEFGIFNNAFMRLAKINKAWIQPITLLWVKGDNKKSKVIVNFGKAFLMGDMSIDEGMSYFMEIQQRGLDENMSVEGNINGRT